MALQTTARLRYVSIPARKMRLVANLVKGMPIQRALDVLNFTKRAAASPIAKTLKSAAANALSQQGTSHLHPEDLMVKTITVDEAPSAKRIRFQSMGRVFRYRKRFSHLTVVLVENPKAVTAAPETGKGKAKKTDGETESKVEAKAEKKTTKKAPARKAAGRKTATKRATRKAETPAAEPEAEE